MIGPGFDVTESEGRVYEALMVGVVPLFAHGTLAQIEVSIEKWEYGSPKRHWFRDS